MRNRFEEADRRLFDEQGRCRAVMDVACGAHPGAEYRAMRGLLMVGVLGFVSDGLS